MINEEDHLRIQCIHPGLDLEGTFKEANLIDDLFEGELPYAFDEQLGYLTHCPTNLGTGLRASVMVHLPALTSRLQIPTMVNSLSKMGLTVRGIFGEGSQAQGNIYQISNQTHIGIYRGRKS